MGAIEIALARLNRLSAYADRPAPGAIEIAPARPSRLSACADRGPRPWRGTFGFCLQGAISSALFYPPTRTMSIGLFFVFQIYLFKHFFPLRPQIINGVMFFLAFDVLLDLVHIPTADGEGAVKALPFEVGGRG